MTPATLATPAAVAVADVPAASRGDKPQIRCTTWRERAEWMAFCGAFLVWLLYVLPARGGWERNVVPTASLLLLPSLLVLRPWRHCRTAVIALAGAPALGAVLVAALAPYGDGGPISLSRWGYFAGLLLVTASFVRTPPRRTVAVTMLLLAGLLQYAQAWLPWWGGGGSVDGPMLGTVYSANPFGSLMLAFALASAGVAVLGEPPLRRLGLLVAPLAACGVVLSAARAAMLIMIAGFIMLAFLGLRMQGLRGLIRCAAVVLLSFAALSFTTSSVFFSAESDALTATASKTTSGQTLDSTTGVRVDYWRAAVGEFLDYPLTGGGSGSYMGSSRLRMAPAAERSPFAHNEVLGSLAEGGLLLGLPVALVFMAAAAACARSLVRGAVGRAAEDPLVTAVVLAAGAVLLHGLVDFALSFPAILGLLGMLLGLCTGLRVADEGPPPKRAVPVALLALAPVLVCGIYVGISHDRAGVSSIAAATGTQSLPGLRDGRLVLAQARQVAAHGRDVISAEQLEQELRPLARLDGQVEALRLDLLDVAGRPVEARRAARALALSSRDRSPLLLLPLAKRIGPEAGGDLLLVEVYTRADESGRVRGQLIDLLEEADDLGRRQEPGWSCAVIALQRSGGLADDTPAVAGADMRTSRSRCAAWAAQAALVLGDTA